MLRKQKKINLDTFLSHRGINLNNYKIEENSIFLRKVLKSKNHQKLLSFNLPYSSVDNTPIRSNKIINSLVSRENDSKVFDNNKTINRSINRKYNFLNSKLNEKSNTKDLNNTNNNFINKERNSINITNRLFNTNIKLKQNKFSGFMKNMNSSSENILNRFLRKKNKNINNNNKKQNNNKIKYLDIVFGPNLHNRSTIIPYNKKENKTKIIYSKKNNFSKFKPDLSFGNISGISRNKKRKFHTQNNSKSKSKNNSITHSIDFSIINKINLKDNFNSVALSKTSDNFFILNKKNKINKNSSEININNCINNSKNMKFLNHFIKYCYLYFMQIIKKFFNNIKNIKNEKIEEKISNIKNNIFEDFNKDDFDKETIKNRTSENFFDTLNDKSFSFFSESKKNSIYNRKRRINNQNFQEKNLLQILNTTTIGNLDKILNFDKKKNCFDNENDKNNNNVQSPFFRREVNQTGNKDKYSLDNRTIILTRNEMKQKSGFINNILGFAKINNENEVNPFNIQDNNINNNNLFDLDIKNKISQNNISIIPENQHNTDDILSFRQSNNPENINHNNNINNSNIIKINNIISKDNKINIDIKYINYSISQNPLNRNNYKDLYINKFFFEFINDKIRVIKISARLKDSKLIKEKEEIIQTKNNNYNFLLTNLSVIKEEESSPKTKTFKKRENYYPISNNSKLYSKISIEKLIDGEKEINEEDIDKILMGSLSDYNNNYHKLKKLKNWQSQEIMVVSNFNSAMRNRRNRKENAKLLIEGLLYVIKFFGILCFNIRKETYIKLKWNWKMNKFINYLISFCIKKNK